ncbi:MAG: Holliday junction resolvase RuvX [Betaproteobacteria bacterium]|nr:Holliday junction resolvase RuvX [Betaproteobacteria bacterium]
MPETQIVLGFDVSLNRLGVAIGNRITKDARPLVQINHADKSQRFAQIAALIDQWEPEALVVGVPGHPDGEALPNTGFCRKFANQLRGRFARPVHEVNENYSSVAAREMAVSDHRIDAWAAVHILDQYLQQAKPA